MMRRALALATLAGCATAPPSQFDDPPIRVSTDTNGAVAVIGPAFELRFAATGLRLPEQLRLNQGRVDLLGNDDLCRGDSRIGIRVEPAVQAAAGTQSNAVRSDITTLLAGPAVAKIRVTFAIDYRCPDAETLVGTSEFTAFPSGRIVREDIAVRPSTNQLMRVGNCGCQQETVSVNFRDLYFSSFWAFQSAGATQVEANGTVIVPGTTIPGNTAACTMYKDRAVAVAWPYISGTSTRYSAMPTSSHSFDWPTTSHYLIDPTPQSVTSAIMISDKPPASLSDCGNVLSGLADVALAIGGTRLESSDHDGIYRDPAPHPTAFEVAAVDVPVPPGFAISVDLGGASHATLTRAPAAAQVGIAQRESGGRFLFVFYDGLSPGESITIEPHM